MGGQQGSRHRVSGQRSRHSWLDYMPSECVRGSVQHKVRVALLVHSTCFGYVSRKGSAQGKASVWTCEVGLKRFRRISHLVSVF